MRETIPPVPPYVFMAFCLSTETTFSLPYRGKKRGSGALSRHLPGEMEENHEQLHSTWSVSKPRFKPDTNKQKRYRSSPAHFHDNTCRQATNVHTDFSGGFLSVRISAFPPIICSLGKYCLNEGRDERKKESRRETKNERKGTVQSSAVCKLKPQTWMNLIQLVLTCLVLSNRYFTRVQ